MSRPTKERRKRWRARVLNASDEAFLRRSLTGNPRLTLGELVEMVSARKGRPVHKRTLADTLKSIGLKAAPSKRRGPPRVLDASDLAFLSRSLKDDPLLTMNQLVEMVAARKHRRVHRRTIADALKSLGLKAGDGHRRIDDGDKAFLITELKRDARQTAKELAKKLSAKKRRAVSRDAVEVTLKELGLKSTPIEAAPPAPPARTYGYNDTHRRSPKDAYPSSVTDVEWELVKHLFEKQGPGRPETYPRRLVFDAICYVVRGGCAWRMLPHEFPPWENVYATFRRWSDEKLFERMNDEMRKLWREREGRDEAPTASVLDSQSVRTAEKGGSTVMTAARKSKVASAIC